MGSTEIYSGKSAAILGIAFHLQKQGFRLAYGKPLGTWIDVGQGPETGANQVQDGDIRFVAQVLNLSPEQIRPPLLALNDHTLSQRLQGTDKTDYHQSLLSSYQGGAEDLVILEGSGTLEEGSVFDLSLLRMAELLDAPVLLVARFPSFQVADVLLSAKQRLGDRLLGVLLNDIPEVALETVHQVLEPFLVQQGIPVFGLLPRHPLLRSVQVRELVKQLKASVLCRPDRLDLMVETLKIGAMNVNAALEYLRKGHNMAVVTGGDRTDIQLAALETATQCLILTGHPTIDQRIISRAEDLEVPILSVDSDTLTTVEIINRTFGQTRVDGLAKFECICNLMAQYGDLEGLKAQLGLVH